MAMAATLGGIAIPSFAAMHADMQAAAAARYVSARLQRARMEAVLRSSDVALRFTAGADGYRFATYVDGNHNGVLARDVDRGVDWRLGPDERLPDHFAGVVFGTVPGLPAVDPGGVPPGDDPIRLGASDTATFAAGGTSSSGSVYIRGRDNRQLVVRIYGDTGKTRVLVFEPGTRLWKPI
jgi:hypothetical protein